MIQLGVMLEIDSVDGLVVGDLYYALKGAAEMVGDGKLTGDFIHDSTGIRVKIRNTGLTVDGTRN